MRGVKVLRGDRCRGVMRGKGHALTHAWIVRTSSEIVVAVYGEKLAMYQAAYPINCTYAQAGRHSHGVQGMLRGEGHAQTHARRQAATTSCLTRP